MGIQEVKNTYHLLQAVAANYRYGFPSRRLTVIGVTGTYGKTTTTSIIYHILKTAGKRVAMISTVGAFIGDRIYDVGFHVTNPAPFPLQRFIRQAVDSGNDYLVLEVTSHGLDQNRVWGIPFSVGVLTNITHEHLDYHRTYDAYVAAKLKLLERSSVTVINMDDGSYRRVIGRLTGGGKKADARILTYSKTHKSASYTPQKFPFTSHLLGAFNISNCLAAVAAAKTAGVTDAVIRKSLRTYRPPLGRQQVVYDQEFKVMVDFAHTPNAFAQLLPEAKKLASGRLIHVFGSAGKRDASKRPAMGEESARYADIIVLTAEDPRDERVDDICGMIAGGINKQWRRVSPLKNIRRRQYTVIPDREQAIRYAVGIAQKGDVLLFSGKSHEKSINYGHGEEPWDEFAVVERALQHRQESD